MPSKLEKSNSPRLKTHYLEYVVPKLMEKYNLKNPMSAPKLQKIVLNIGLSDAKENIKVVDSALAEVSSITGQRPIVTRSKKSISNFKIRQGMPIGLKVTLRRDRMYEFCDRLVTAAIPRIRDFRGLEPNGFDGNGNYNLGLTEQHIFLEINLEKSEKIRGMNITFVTSAQNDDQAKTLLDLFGFPFKKRKGQEAEA